MHIDDLRTVALIADLGSFTAAGSYLNMTQSAVSHRIRQVERELGFVLFVREGRGVRLTPAGEELVGVARGVNEQLLHIRRRYASGPHQEALVIGLPPPGATWILPNVLKEFFERSPTTMIRIRSHTEADIRAGLLRGELDFGILHSAHLGDGIAGELQSHSSLILVAPAGHPLLCTPVPSAREIARHPFIMDTSRGERGVAQSWADSHQVSLRPILEVDSTLTVLAAVAAGIGLGFVSDIAAQTALSLRRVALLDAPGTPIQQDVYLAYNEHHARSGAWQAFLGCFRDGHWRVPRPASGVPASSALFSGEQSQTLFPWDLPCGVMDTGPSPAARGAETAAATEDGPARS